MAAISASERVELPIPASKRRQRPAQRDHSEASRCRPARRQRPAGSCPGHRRSTVRPPARPRISPCGAPNRMLRPWLRPRRRVPRPPNPARGPSPVPRTPTPSAHAVAQAQGRSGGRRHDSAPAPMRRTGPRRARRRPVRSARRLPPPDRHRQAPTPGRPRCGPARASRAGAGMTHGCCGPTTPMGPAALGARWRDRPGRCRSGPDRRRRRPAATARTVSLRRAGASGRESSPNAAFASAAVVMGLASAEVVMGAATLSTRRALPHTGEYGVEWYRNHIG